MDCEVRVVGEKAKTPDKAIREPRRHCLWRSFAPLRSSSRDEYATIRSHLFSVPIYCFDVIKETKELAELSLNHSGHTS